MLGLGLRVLVRSEIGTERHGDGEQRDVQHTCRLERQLKLLVNPHRSTCFTNNTIAMAYRVGKGSGVKA